MFREFNVKFENVEMIGGSDNILEGTEVTKVIVRGDSKMSSLDSAFKNCSELDTVDGELDLNGVSDIDNMLEETLLLKSINVKNVNNPNITATNSISHIEQINIGGEVYDKRAIQNVIGSREWTFNNVTYSGTVAEELQSKTIEIIDDNKATINNALEQKVREIEITGQTYNNLIIGSGETTLIDELSMESIEGKPNEFNPHLEQEVCVEVIEGQTYQNLVEGKEEKVLIDEFTHTVNDFANTELNPTNDQSVCVEEISGETYQNLIEGKGEYKLTDTFSTTWTESNNSIDNPPSMIEIPEIWGNTVQGYCDLLSAKDFVEHFNNIKWTSSDIYAEHYSDNTFKVIRNISYYANEIRDSIASDNSKAIKLKPSTKYTIWVDNGNCSLIVSTPNSVVLDNVETRLGSYTFTTDSTGLIGIGLKNTNSTLKSKIRLVEGEIADLHNTSHNFNLNYIQSVGDLYVDESGEPILDEDGNEQYKIEINSVSKNLWDGKTYHKGRKSRNEQWGAIDGQYTDNWGLKEPYGIQYDITGSSMRGPTIPIEGLVGGKYINFTFKLTMPQYVPNITVHFFNENKGYIGSIFNRWDGGLTGNINSNTTYTDLDGVYLGGIIPKEATCCEIVYALSQPGDTNPHPQHIEITNLMVTVDDSAIMSYRECEPQQSNKTTILMPQPLRKIKTVDKGYVYDKLYWDNSNNKYFIEKVVGKQVVNVNNLAYADGGHVFNKLSEKTNLFKLNIAVSNIPSDFIKTDFTNNIRSYCICDKAKGYDDYEIHWSKDEVCCAYGYNTRVTSGTLGLVIWRLPKEYDNVEKSIDYLKSLGDITFYVMVVPETIETKILEKPSLETYSPKTYISTNTEVQPSQMAIANKRTILSPLSLQANTDYTLQLDSTGKDDKPITVNLGGTETTIQPVNDTSKHHKVVVRTPATLTNETLELSGEGVVANDVMLFQGGSNDIKQEVEYVEGIESIGKIEIMENLIEYNTIKGFTYGNASQNIYTDEDTIVFDFDKVINFNTWVTIPNPFKKNLEIGKEYTLVVRILENTTSGTSKRYFAIYGTTSGSALATLLFSENKDFEVGVIKSTFKFEGGTNTNNSLRFRLEGKSLDTGEIIRSGKLVLSKDFMLLEGDYTDKPIPDFVADKSI